MNQDTQTLIRLNDVTKSFKLPAGKFNALEHINLAIGKGKMISITGKSGSGKSTLLNIVTGIDKPSEGSVIINGVKIDKLGENDLASWRGRNVGIVFQFFQLMPTLTIVENVMLPMDFCNTYSTKDRKVRALDLLELLNIREQADKFPSALSGGQQQRAAIARALANDPPILVADEPTGNLDSQTATSIFEIFKSLTKAGKTVIVVTHEKEFHSFFEQNISIADGRILTDVVVSN